MTGGLCNSADVVLNKNKQTNNVIVKCSIFNLTYVDCIIEVKLQKINIFISIWMLPCLLELWFHFIANTTEIIAMTSMKLNSYIGVKVCCMSDGYSPNS